MLPTNDFRPDSRVAARGIPEQPSLARNAPRRQLLLALAGATLATVFAPRVTHAQLIRSFPPSARFGRFELRVFPDATLDDEPVRLSAGARIHDTNNRIVMPATLSGSFEVLVEREPTGQIGRVWILTAEESSAAKQRERR